jgi:single-stranded DNA-binding protein
MDMTTIVGNVGFISDPRTVTVRGEQTSVTDVLVIVNKRYKRGNETVESSKSYTVPFWGKLSDVASQHIEKGQTLRVTGEVYADAYLDKNDKPAATLKIQLQPVNGFEFIGGKPSNRGSRNGSYERSAAPVAAGAGFEGASLDDEIPF